MNYFTRVSDVAPSERLKPFRLRDIIGPHDKKKQVTSSGTGYYPIHSGNRAFIRLAMNHT